MAANYGRSVIRSRTAGTGRKPPLGTLRGKAQSERRESANSGRSDFLKTCLRMAGFTSNPDIFKSSLRGDPAGPK